MAFAVLLLVVIKQHCFNVGAPFWIEDELPVFVVRHHALTCDVCTLTVRYEYMHCYTPSVNMYNVCVLHVENVFNTFSIINTF